MGLLLILLFIIGFALAAYAVAAVLDDKDQSIVARGVFLLALTSVFFFFLPDLNRRLVSTPSDRPSFPVHVGGFPLEAVISSPNPCCSLARLHYYAFLPTLIDWIFFVFVGIVVISLLRNFVPFKTRSRLLLACAVLVLGFMGFMFLISKDDDDSMIFSRHIDPELACLKHESCTSRVRGGGKGG